MGKESEMKEVAEMMEEGLGKMAIACSNAGGEAASAAKALEKDFKSEINKMEEKVNSGWDEEVGEGGMSKEMFGPIMKDFISEMLDGPPADHINDDDISGCFEKFDFDSNGTL